MDRREEDIAMLQTAVWLAEKLARLCRELLAAQRKNAQRDIERLQGEIDAHIRSLSFAQAVAMVGAEYFYPEKLRMLRYLLERGYAETMEDALAMMDKMQG